MKIAKIRKEALIKKIEFIPFTIDDKIPYIKDHLTEVVEIFQEELFDLGIKINLKLTNDDLRRMIKNVPHFRQSKTPEEITESFDGQIYSQTIRTVGKCIRAIIAKKDDGTYYYTRNFNVIIALMQSGKTALMFACSFLPVLLNLLTGEKSLFLRLLIDSCSLEKQCLEEGSNFQEVYSKISFSKNGKELNFDSYETELLETFRDFPEKFLGKYTGIGVRTSTSKKKGDFDDFAEMCKNNKVEPIVFCDESHARFDAGGNLDKLMSNGFSGKPNEKINVDHWHGKISFFGLSATNYALQGIVSKHFNDKSPIVMLPGSNYTGVLRILNGTPIDKDIINGTSIWASSIKMILAKMPKNKNHNKINDIFDNADIAFKESEFIGEKSKNDKLKNVDFQQFKNDWLSEFLKFIQFVLSKGNVCNGKGIIARIINNNDVCRDVAEYIKTNSDINVVIHTSEGNPNGLTIREQVDFVCGQKRENPYIILVSNGARMGSVIPKDCKYGLDFSRESEMQSLLQGVVGRICGYGKGQTMAILSDNNYKKIDEYMNDGILKKSPCRKHVSLSKSQHSPILTESKGEIPKKLYKDLQNWLSNAAKVYFLDAENKKEIRKAGDKLLSSNLIERMLIVVRNTRIDSDKEIKFDPNGLIMRNNVGVRVATRHGDSINIYDDDSQGPNRPAPVFYLDDDLKLIGFRVRVLDNGSINEFGIKNAHALGEAFNK